MCLIDIEGRDFICDLVHTMSSNTRIYIDIREVRYTRVPNNARKQYRECYLVLGIKFISNTGIIRLYFMLYADYVVLLKLTATLYIKPIYA